MGDCIKGSFLIAAPHLGDPNFERTVALIADHSEEGGFGLVLNRPAALDISKLWKMLTGEHCSSTATTFVGGPVESLAVFLLHSCRDLADGSEEIVPGVYLGNEVELLGRLIERQEELRREGPSSEIFRVFCGYSGWGKGQLDHELETGSWLVQPASAEFVFSTPADKMWMRTMEKVGGPYRLFSLMPKRPELN